MINSLMYVWLNKLKADISPEKLLRAAILHKQYDSVLDDSQPAPSPHFIFMNNKINIFYPVFNKQLVLYRSAEIIWEQEPRLSSFFLFILLLGNRRHLHKVALNTMSVLNNIGMGECTAPKRVLREWVLIAGNESPGSLISKWKVYFLVRYRKWGVWLTQDEEISSVLSHNIKFISRYSSREICRFSLEKNVIAYPKSNVKMLCFFCGGNQTSGARPDKSMWSLQPPHTLRSTQPSSACL